MQFKIGDFIRYATTGVCEVCDIKELRSADRRSKRTFYVLKPVSNKNSTVYVPIDNEVLVEKMRYILNKPDIDNLLSTVKDSEIKWIADRKERMDSFHKIIKKCDQQELLRLIGCIYLKKQELTGIGKKLTSSDEAVLSQAESLVENEFSFVLQITESEVSEYIKEKLGM